MVTLDILVSGSLAILLVLMIYSAWMLDRRLKTLRNGGAEMRELIDGLDRAAESAQASIAQLKAATQEFDADWQSNMDKARALSDELSVITHSGENLAERLTNDLVAAPSKKARGVSHPTLQGLTKGSAGQDNDVVRALRGVR